ncbi:MAG: GT4 family glycosyltransferase PelF [Candidatus Omnitrophica bacterium]|nr:GT4 family glycosyltransferase PelF [Candidatus Omnitrophota bacterium]
MNDVCLFLEGTYPYVAGGVSGWVSDLIKRMDDVTFSVVYLGAKRSAAKKMHYALPDNVLDFRELYLFDYGVKDDRRNQFTKGQISLLEDFLKECVRGETKSFYKFADKMLSGEITFYDIIFSYDAWKILERMYERDASDQSFLDYFWTWRFMYLPLFSLLKVQLPPARVYHSVSTGYAGVLGALAKHQHGRPYIVTEHGIYTRERKIDISQADWIYSKDASEIKVTERSDIFKGWWINLFIFFSKIAYESADSIVTLYEGNRAAQINEGADAASTAVIPNGVDFDEFQKLSRIPRGKNFRIGFMGRVVPIKDVKTLLMAMRMVKEELKDIEVYIMGPTDEDQEYFRECQLLVETQSLKDVVRFTGKVNVKEYYPKLDILVLTSISEGQPIVILEAHAMGIPVVATNVGSCSELLYGSSRDDKLLGPSGIVTPVSNPEATAQGIVKILKDPLLYKRMSETAVARTSRYYRMEALIANYRMMYQKYIEEIRWQA